MIDIYRLTISSYDTDDTYIPKHNSTDQTTTAGWTLADLPVISVLP